MANKRCKVFCSWMGEMLAGCTAGSAGRQLYVAREVGKLIAMCRRGPAQGTSCLAVKTPDTALCWLRSYGLHLVARYQHVRILALSADDFFYQVRLRGDWQEDGLLCPAPSSVLLLQARPSGDKTA